MPDGSYSISDIQDYFEYVIKKQETIEVNPLMPGGNEKVTYT